MAKIKIPKTKPKGALPSSASKPSALSQAEEMAVRDRLESEVAELMDIPPFTTSDRAAAGRAAAELIKSQPQVKMSEALGSKNLEGKGRLSTTQADRTRVGGGNIGGGAFPAISEADPNYEGKVWGVMDSGTASRLINLTSPEVAWTTMLGSANQLKTNPIVFSKLEKEFRQNMKAGLLPPELESKINQNLRLFMGEGADIRDPKIWKDIDTFEKRALMADLMMGQGLPPQKGGVSLGGEKSGKGVIFKPTETLIRETEPSLLHTEHGGDVPTFALGPRLFTLEKEYSYRPDLHPGFPTLIHGKDLGQNVIPVPNEIALPDWHARFKEMVGGKRKPGYYDLALGIKGEGLPSQVIDHDYLMHLSREGHREGGMVDQALTDKVNAPAAKAMLEMDLARLAVAKDKMQPKKMAKGGIGKVKAPKVNAPAVVPRSTLTELQNLVREREGGYGAARLERAADEIKNLEALYSQEALRRAFTGDNATALMTMNPADFEKYATPLPPKTKVDPSSGVMDKYSVTTDDYIKYLAEAYRKGGFDDVPFLEINKTEQGLPLTPFISGHEGRHRNRAMAGAGEEAGLVQLLPRAELREPFPRRYREDYIEALKKELEMTGNKVLPQTWREADPNSFNDKVIRRPEIDLPDIYAKGGKVKLPKNVLPAADRAANFERYMQDAAIRDRLFHATTATEGMKGEEALSSLKLSREGALGSGIYMHPDPEHVGKWYAEGEGGNILPLHTNMKNPLYITGEHADPMKEALIKLGVDPDKADSIVERAYEQKGYIGKEVQSRAQEAGYDGLVQVRDGEIGEVVSYNPMNVKSATGNTGEYKNWSGLLGNKNGGMVSFPSVEEMRIEMMERKNAQN